MAGDKTLPSEFNCDIVFGSTQKCFALPPGLAVALVNDRAIERAKQVPNRGAYTDLVDIFEFEKKHQTPFTPNISLLYALNKRMDLLLEETYDKVYQRHLDMANYTQKWAKKHFAMFPEARLRIHNCQLHTQHLGQKRQGTQPETSRKRLS